MYDEKEESACMMRRKGKENLRIYLAYRVHLAAVGQHKKTHLNVSDTYMYTVRETTIRK